jgi:hypothetical protein
MELTLLAGTGYNIESQDASEKSDDGEYGSALASDKDDGDRGSGFKLRAAKNQLFLMV